jgi:hypothetical protein
MITDQSNSIGSTIEMLIELRGELLATLTVSDIDLFVAVDRLIDALEVKGEAA